MQEVTLFVAYYEWQCEECGYWNSTNNSDPDMKRACNNCNEETIITEVKCNE